MAAVFDGDAAAGDAAAGAGDATTDSAGLAVRCALDGTVLEVLHDGIGTGIRPGRLVSEVFGPASVEDALWLLTEVAGAAVTQPWELVVLDASGRGHPTVVLGTPLEVGAVGAGGPSLVLLAAADRRGLDALIDRLAPQLPQVEACRSLGDDADASRASVDRETLIAFSATNNELVTMHRELARQAAQLEAINRRKDEILAMVAHDLRSPLGSIAGFAVALRRQLHGRLDERSELMLERISRLSEEMLLLVDDLVDTSVIERDSLTLQRTEVALVALLREVVDSHRLLAARKGIEVALVVPERDLTALLDRRRLVQVVDNLLSNAVKFSPVDRGARITVTLAAQPDLVLISVSDEGPGIPAGEQPTLFEPFVRGSNLTTAAERSTGLGLAITRSIVTAHGGTIGVCSEVGRGARFEVRLPTVAGVELGHVSPNGDGATQA